MEEVMKAIVAERDEIHRLNLWDRPELLSKCMTRLAVRNHQLAEHIAPLEKTYRETELITYNKVRKSMTQGDAEKESKKESIQAKENFENARLINKATRELINVIQSRLKVLAEQARGNQ